MLQNHLNTILSKQTAIIFGLVFLLFASIGLSQISVNAQITEKSYPDSSTYKSVSDAGKKIGESLCKKSKNKSECVEKYRQEYLFLAKKKCQSDRNCYKNFVKKNKKIGQARKAAGLSASKPANTTGSDFKKPGSEGDNQCGKGDSVVYTKINFGCQGDEYPEDNVSPILDLVLALVKFLSVGVGVIVVGSIIYAGIQYSSSQGSPEQTAQAKERIQNAMIALIFYLFIFAIVQWIVPGGLFSSSLSGADSTVLHWMLRS